MTAPGRLVLDLCEPWLRMALAPTCPFRAAAPAAPPLAAAIAGAGLRQPQPAAWSMAGASLGPRCPRGPPTLRSKAA
jgi:hypothetical protein